MRALLTTLLCVVMAPVAAAPDQANDAAIILTFQRAADSYAFAHRQQERRGAVEPSAEGRLFTPLVADAFRARLSRAMARGGCAPVIDDVEVPRVNAPAANTAALPPCLAEALPKLPAELEYHTAGVALLLVDAHLRVVVDVLHGAFPARDAARFLASR